MIYDPSVPRAAGRGGVVIAAQVVAPPPPDTLAPVLSSATGAQSGITTANLGVTTNEANGTLYAFVSTSSTSPSIANLKAGTGAVYAASQTVTSVGTKTAAATGLAASTTYYVHWVHTDAVGNDSNVVKSTAFTTNAIQDTTAPTLSNPTGVQSGTTTANLGVTTNEGNGTLYVYVSTSATAPNATTLKAGSGAAFATSQSVTSTGTKSVSATGLTASTLYYAHWLHRDTAGNESGITTTASFTTAALADTTAPVLSNPISVQTSPTTGTVGVDTNDATGTLYTYVSTSSTPPSAANLKAGTGAVYSAALTITTTGSKTASATGLTASTLYYAHWLHRDGAGNDSAIVTTPSFTTAASAPAGTYPQTIVDRSKQTVWDLEANTGPKLSRDNVASAERRDTLPAGAVYLSFVENGFTQWYVRLTNAAASATPTFHRWKFTIPVYITTDATKPVTFSHCEFTSDDCAGNSRRNLIVGYDGQSGVLAASKVYLNDCVLSNDGHTSETNPAKILQIGSYDESADPDRFISEAHCYATRTQFRRAQAACVDMYSHFTVEDCFFGGFGMGYTDATPNDPVHSEAIWSAYGNLVVRNTLFDATESIAVRNPNTWTGFVYINARFLHLTSSISGCVMKGYATDGGYGITGPDVHGTKTGTWGLCELYDNVIEKGNSGYLNLGTGVLRDEAKLRFNRFYDNYDLPDDAAVSGVLITEVDTINQAFTSTDIVQPVLTAPVASASGTTTSAMGVTTDEANGTIYWVITTNSKLPTLHQIRTGQNSSGTAAVKSGSQAVSAAGDKTFTATGLTASTVYYTHFVQRDALGNYSLPISAASFTTSAVGDTTAPVLSTATAVASGATGGTLGVTTNEANGTIYWVVTTAATAPTAVQVEAGQNSAGAAAVASGSQAVTTTGAKSFTATGLTASTGYYAHYMHKDASNNRSAVLSAAQFTTETGAAPPLGTIAIDQASIRFPSTHEKTTGTSGAPAITHLSYLTATSFANNSTTAPMFTGDQALVWTMEVPWEELDGATTSAAYAIMGNLGGVTGVASSPRSFGAMLGGRRHATFPGRLRFAMASENVTGSGNPHWFAGDIDISAYRRVVCVFRRVAAASADAVGGVDTFLLEAYSEGTRVAVFSRDVGAFSPAGTRLGSDYLIGIMGSTGQVAAPTSQSNPVTSGAHSGMIGSIGMVGLYVGSTLQASFAAMSLGRRPIEELTAANWRQYRELKDTTTASLTKPSEATGDTTVPFVATVGSTSVGFERGANIVPARSGSAWFSANFVPDGWVWGLVPGQSTRTVTFSGKASGLTGTVEVRVFNSDGQLTKDWTVLSGSTISGGAWSGTVELPPNKGWGHADFRPTATPALVYRLRTNFGVGYKFGFMGQSQLSIAEKQAYTGLQPGSNVALSHLHQDTENTDPGGLLYLKKSIPGRAATDFAAAAADAARQYTDAPIMMIGYTRAGTSMADMMDDDVVPPTAVTRQWSDIPLINTMSGNDLSAMIINWATSDQDSLNMAAGYLHPLITGATPTGPLNFAYQPEHYLRDGTFHSGMAIALSPVTRHTDALASGTRDFSGLTAVNASRKAYSDYQTTFPGEVAAIGPSLDDMAITSAGGPHEPTNVDEGPPRIARRLVLGLLRAVGVPLPVDAAITGATRASNGLSITVNVSRPNGGVIQTAWSLKGVAVPTNETTVQGFEISTDNGATWSRSGSTATAAKKFTAAITDAAGGVVTLTKTDTATPWPAGTRIRYLANGPLDYGIATESLKLYHGMLYESGPPEGGLGLPVKGLFTATL